MYRRAGRRLCTRRAVRTLCRLPSRSLRRHPAALASMARYHTRACLEGARQSYRAARTELAESVPPHAVDSMLAALRTEGFKLAGTARAVELVEHALRGEVPAPRFR